MTRPPGALLALALIVTPAAAGEAWPVPRGPSHEPDPYRYDPAQLRRVPKEFLEDAAACVLYAGITHLVEPDGTVESITHEVTRLGGRKGIEKLGEARNIAYDPSYQKLTLHTARIHKADGRILDVEPRHVHLRDVATDFQVYDHDKQLIISFPTLEVGDVIEVKWSVRGKHPEHGGQFFTRYSFGDPDWPVCLDLFRVRLPKDKPFHFAAVGGKLDPQVAEADGFRTYTWKALNCRKAPQDDNLPSREDLLLSLACSTFNSWAEVGQWKKRLRADCWECTAAVRQVVQEVTRGLTRPEDKARALTHWMRRNIRYVSAGEKHDYTPHPPALVVANRYGDCKDTSQLLAVMLRESGLHVELATLGALDDGQVHEAVPSPWGTHAILLVTIDGAEHWIDTTSSLAGWDFLPRDDRDRLCYVVDEQGAVRLMHTPRLTAAGNRIEQTTHVSVGADGSSRCERTTVAHGSAALAQRDTFLEVPAGERRRQMTAELQDANSRTRLVRLRLDEAGLRDYDRPVNVGAVFEVPGHFSGGPEREGSIADSKVWNKLLAFNLDYERTVALNLGQPFESRHTYHVHLPPAYHLDAVPRDVTVRTPWALFTRTVTAPEGDGPVHDVTVQFHTRLDRALIRPADFEEFRKFHEEVSGAYRCWLTLKPARELSEAPLLEAFCYWAPQDSDSAAILARLYLKNDRAADARHVLARARYYRPDDTELGELAVVAAGTAKEKEAVQRELVRRSPGEPRHLLKLASILVGAGKQEEARALLEPLTRGGTAAQRAQAHFQLARSYYRRDQLKEALAQWEKAAAADAGTVHTVKAYHLQGRIHQELGQRDEAEAAYEQALTVDGDSELALESLVRLELSASDRPHALDYLRRYAVAVGDDPAGLLLAAGYYLRLGLHEEGLEILGRAGAPADAASHFTRGESDPEAIEALLRAHLALGRLSEAVGRLPAADRIEKPAESLRWLREQVHTLQARRTELERAAPAPEGKAKEWAAALDAVVCAAWARSEGWPRKQVAALLKPAFADGLAPGPALALRGRLALEYGKLGKALADAEQAVTRSPRDAIGWYVRGRVRLERGDREAVADLAKAAELSGRKDAHVLHALAEALFRAGRVPEALVAQRAAVRLKPKDAEMAEQLAAFEQASAH